MLWTVQVEKSAADVSPLVFVGQNMNSDEHIDILEANQRPVIARHLGREQWYFQDGKWKRRNDTFFFSWPPQSRVPSSNVWFALKNDVRKNICHITTVLTMSASSEIEGKLDQ